MQKKKKKKKKKLIIIKCWQYNRSYNYKLINKM